MKYDHYAFSLVWPRLLLLALIALPLGNRALGQTNARPQPTAQRELRLPFNGDQDLILQYQMMQRLADLSKANKASATASTTAKPAGSPVDYSELLKGVKPEDLAALRPLAEKLLQNQTQQPNSGGTQIPPELLEALGVEPGDPRIQDLLRQFNQAGKLPEASSKPPQDQMKQKPWIPSWPNANRPATPNDTPNANGAPNLPGGPNQTRPATPNDNSTDSPSNQTRPAPVTDASRRTDRQPNTQQPNTQQPNTQQPNTQQPNTQQPNTQQPNTQQPNTQRGNTRPGFANDTSRRRQSDNAFDPSTQTPNRRPTPPAFPPAGDSESTANPPLPRPGEASSRRPGAPNGSVGNQRNSPQSPSGQPNNSQPLSGKLLEQLRALGQAQERQQSSRGGGLPPLQEFLQQAQQDPSTLPSMGELLRRMPDADQLPLDELAKIGRNGGDPSKIGSGLQSRLPKELINNLDRAGLKKTFENIVRDSKRESSLKKVLQSDNPGNDPGNDPGVGQGLEKAFLSALDGVRGELFEDPKKNSTNEPQASGRSNAPASKNSPQIPSAANAQSSTGGPNNSKIGGSTANSNNSNPKIGSSQTNGSKSGNGKSFFSGISKFVNRMAMGSGNNQSNASAPFAGGLSAPSVSPPSAAAPALGPLAASTGTLLSSLMLPVLVICGLAIAAIWWLRRQKSSAMETGLVHSTADIQNPHDIVQAFHNLVRRDLPTRAEEWWNHRLTAERLANETPAQKQSWQQLATLYELARYAPPIEKLAPEKIETARHIIQSLAQPPAPTST